MKKIMAGKNLLKKSFLQGFVGGLGWSLGATLGFVVIVGLISWVLGLLGGLPIVGDFFANLISTTEQALELRRAR